jgi:hypothetical protein
MKQIINEFLASAIVNGNEVRLITRDNRYFIHWGKEGRIKTEQELLTLEGNPAQESEAIKQFLKAIEAAQYLTFSRL